MMRWFKRRQQLPARAEGITVVSHGKTERQDARRTSPSAIPNLMPNVMPDGSLAISPNVGPTLANAEPSVPALIQTTHDLPAFTRALYDELGMAQSLRHQLCPVLVEDSTDAGRGRFALVVLADMQHSDVTEEIVRQARLRYDPATPLMYVAAPQVMTALSRGVEAKGRRPGAVAAPSAGGRDTNALWQTFLAAAQFALREQASDIHFEVKDNSDMSQIRFAIDGVLVAPPAFRLRTGDLLDMLGHVWQQGKGGSQGIFSRVLPQQTRVWAEVDGVPLVFRWASMQSADGHVTVMRVNREKVATQQVDFVTDLGFFDQQAAVIDRCTMQLGGGVVLVGTVGSGKTTTAHAVMQRLPDWMNKMSIEDPVELLARGTHHFSVSRQLDGANREEDPFIVAKRQLKRMNPHFVMVGEVRDYESAGLFRDVAGAGLRALTTVHAPSAVAATDRLADSELRIPRSVLATPGFVNLYVYQTLLPRTCSCGHGQAEAKRMLGAAKLRQIERLFRFDVDHIRVRRQAGCDKCRRANLPELNGIRGRVMAAEMFEPDEIDLMYIRDARAIELQAHQRGKRETGFDIPDCTGKSVFEVAMYHVYAGTVDPCEAERILSLDAYERKLRRAVRTTQAASSPSTTRSAG
ncbi:ATPase, T2SS/T4P/T4SS family [Cupriavidus pauculus]|uniref:ATPase, T2SS/T4P/T4SS family n=1 Tax=Cupriavidus pauculus TaxID=82633 RepID=UPI001EE2898B|nr:ATPase, T2SS/T4P/T4SS family [Cupriavidus pauculus]GJG97751.1 pilus assembly protein [Cupriavidus pauculus]